MALKQHALLGQGTEPFRHVINDLLGFHRKPLPLEMAVPGRHIRCTSTLPLSSLDYQTQPLHTVPEPDDKIQRFLVTLLALASLGVQAIPVTESHAYKREVVGHSYTLDNVEDSGTYKREVGHSYTLDNDEDSGAYKREVIGHSYTLDHDEDSGTYKREVGHSYTLDNDEDSGAYKREVGHSYTLDNDEDSGAYKREVIGHSYTLDHDEDSGTYKHGLPVPPAHLYPADADEPFKRTTDA
ncbi:hypothetical protein DACRYDRAFT_102405 [Dacryopinax primogenitus]|uniref:Uncharacterized protein n=1 Tax=Dacryopinax primogenitus (strain DJM 731) TaxID=1858805 RepID=M5G0D6_DACPD|nr:uncharacterized protein DACRYDRAFT_102405 [Dacryopinax primogenitus]EJT97262.1 hypothetical protein DACRYDRAFT_102405 [Dacryopinax primogenitus]